MTRARKTGYRRYAILPPALTLIGLGACQWFADEADKEVYRLIAQRQEAALGFTSSADLGPAAVPARPGDTAYQFAPHPVPAGVPRDLIPSSQRAEPGAEEPPASGPATASAPAEAGQPLEMTFTDIVRYAFAHARDFQSAKEDLYLAALDLTLERHLWTPRFVSSQLSAEYANYGQIRQFDRAMAAVAEFAVEQRLPYGGTVTARTINTLMRDLGHHITSAETGQAILEADIPLLRGAGKTAYESRYQAERNLIYAVRSFERFRQTFLTDVLSDYFSLLNGKQQVANAEESIKAFQDDVARASALVEAERLIQLESQRAENTLLREQNNVLSTQEEYETSLDQFKIRIGMPTTQRIELAEEDIPLREPTINEQEAITAALSYRLDLLNELDRVDDSRRQVEIAKNGLLPDLNVVGSLTMDTDPAHLRMFDYDIERLTWRGSASLEVPLERYAERNALRDAMVQLERAKRNHDLAADRVRQEVRRALRRLELSRGQLLIQQKNMEIAEVRRRAAKVRFELGQISNRDQLEAERDLLDARNGYASALASYRQAIVQLHRDTGTLRVEDDGRWLDVARPID